MKKITLYVLTAALLCILSLAVFLYAHGQLTARGEDVTVTETILFGDQREAEGIEIRSVIQAHDDTDTNNPLLRKSMDWNLCWSPGDQKASADFSLGGHIYHHDPPEIHLWASIGDEMGWNQSDCPGFDLEEGIRKDHVGGIPDDETRQLLLDSAAKAPAGKTTRTAISLRNYYRFFPLQSTYFNSFKADLEYSDVTGFFRIPMPDVTADLTITRDADGTLTSIIMNWAELHLDYCGLTGDDEAWIAVNGITDGKDQLISTPSKSTCGIFRIPIVGASEEQKKPYPNQAKRLCSLPGNARVLAMADSWDQTSLLVLTEEDGMLWLQAISKENGKTASRHQLCPAPDFIYSGTLRLLNGQGFAAVVLRNGDLYCFTDQNDGYRPFVKDNLLRYSEPPEMESMDRISAAFDGKRLAVATLSPYDGSVFINGVDLQVFDQSGLIYAARCKNSIDNLLASPQPGLDFQYYTQSISVATFADKGEKAAVLPLQQMRMKKQNFSA